MTKALVCKSCLDVRAFLNDGSLTTCQCGKVQGWWTDAYNGLAVMHTPDPEDRPLAHVLSLHNGMLVDGPGMVPQTYPDHLTHNEIPFPRGQVDQFWRQLHEQATVCPPAPETARLWDRSARNCWAIILTPGLHIDVAWAKPDEVQSKLKSRELVTK